MKLYAIRKGSYIWGSFSSREGHLTFGAGKRLVFFESLVAETESASQFRAFRLRKVKRDEDNFVQGHRVK